MELIAKEQLLELINDLDKGYKSINLPILYEGIESLPVYNESETVRKLSIQLNKLYREYVELQRICAKMP